MPHSNHHRTALPTTISISNAYDMTFVSPRERGIYTHIQSLYPTDPYDICAHPRHPRDDDMILNRHALRPQPATGLRVWVRGVILQGDRWFRTATCVHGGRQRRAGEVALVRVAPVRRHDAGDRAVFGVAATVLGRDGRDRRGKPRAIGDTETVGECFRYEAVLVVRVCGGRRRLLLLLRRVR